MRVNFLVAGGAGFIGSHLVERLLSLGHNVKVIDDLSTGKIENIEHILDNIEFIKASITDFTAVAEAIYDTDVVFHFAANPFVIDTINDPIGSTEVNFTGTLNLLEAARRENVKAFIFSSSSAVYGDSKTLPVKEDMLSAPLSPYAAAKLASEYFVQLYADTYELPAVSLRYMNIFGERQNPESLYAAVIPKFIRKMLLGERVEIFGDGEQTRDFLYVENVIDANIVCFNMLFDNKLHSGVFNIGSGEKISINQLVKILEAEIGVKADVAYAPERKGEIRHSYCDPSKAKEILNFEPEIHFKEGIKKMIAYLKSTLV